MSSTDQFPAQLFHGAAQELATLAFYLACGSLFRPLPAGANPYFALDSEEIELAA